MLLAFCCGRTEFEHSVSVKSESVFTPAVYHVKNLASSCTVCVIEIENIVRSVNSHLTWEMPLNKSFRPLFSVYETIKAAGMKGHICARLVEQSLNVRVTSFGQRFSQLSVLKKASCNLPDDCSFRRLRKILNCGNCGVYYIPSSRRQKRRFRLRLFFRY